MAVALARIRMPLIYLTLALMLVDSSIRDLPRWPLARLPADYPGFGQPVLASAEGTVVRVHDPERDHWSRTSLPAMLYLVVEGIVRELLGPWRILGNHVVVDLGNGVFAAFAHLRRGSIRVRRGDRVTLGQQLAECGNSGNSTEPHLHFQLMDHPSVLLAGGLPTRFRDLAGVAPGGPGVPRNLQPFTAPGPEPAPSTVPAGPSDDGQLETRVPA